MNVFLFFLLLSVELWCWEALNFTPRAPRAILEKMFSITLKYNKDEIGIYLGKKLFLKIV